MTRGVQEFWGTSRFRVVRRLGSGGMGVVYEVLDQGSGIRSALKTLLHLDPDSLLRLKREFRSLQGIHHPNLVRLGELIEDNGQWFFTMELVDGVDFARFVSGSNAERVEIEQAPTVADRELKLAAVRAPVELPSPTQLFDPARLRAALLQLATGLEALHAAGKVHRDIKSSNVLVSREGRVVVLDFGLVAEDETSGPPEVTTVGRLIGTPAYMSPEQALGLRASAASDWYSVGVMLFVALTGKLPFSGTASEVLHAKAEREPPAPAEVTPGTPDDLNALCAQLLRRRAEQRPSGQQVLRLLDGKPAEPVARPSRRSRPALIGRVELLGALEAAERDSARGRPVLAYVHGSSGMGKTALLQEFVDELWARNEVVILAGRCYERETVPYKAVDSLVDELSRYLTRLPGEEAAALMPRDVQTLARLFPVLARVPAVASAPRRDLDAPDPLELRRRAFAALRELLARITDRRPLVFFIDDVQWGDVDSATLLADILRAPDPPPLLLLASYRTEEEHCALLDVLRAQEDLAADRREIIVGQLSYTESRELALALLGRDDVVARSRAESIARESGGSPFFIGELVRYGQEREADGGSSAPAGTAEISLDRVVAERVSHLPAEARRLLEVVAVAAGPLDRRVARHAAELAAADEGTIDLLRGRHLVRSRRSGEREALESYHDRIRQSVVAALDGAQKAEYHRRLAAALEASGDSDPEALAVHYQSAGDGARACFFAGRAAAQADEALAFDRAAKLYRLSLDLGCPDDPGRRELWAKLGAALANAGRGPDAAESFLRATEGASAPEAIELQRRAAEQFLRSGHVDRGLDLVQSVLATLGLKLPPTPRRALLSLLWQRARIRLRGLGFRERDAAGIDARELVRIDTCWALSNGLALIDPIRGADFQSRTLLLALRAGDPFRIARGLAMEGAYSGIDGTRGAARTAVVLRAATAHAERLGQPYPRGLAKLAEGVAAFLRGSWQVGRESLELAEATLRERCNGVAWELSTAQMLSFACLYWLGETAQLDSRVPRAVTEALDRGDLYSATLMRVFHSGRMGLAADDPTRARDRIVETISAWSQHGFHVEHADAVYSLAQIDLYRGEGGTALQRVQEALPKVGESLQLRVQYIRIEWLDLHARCALAAARAPAAAKGEDPRQLLRDALRDAKRLENEHAPWATGLALLIRAGVAAARGAAGEAEVLLAEAMTDLERAGMALHAAVARRRRGELLAGSEGQALIEAADTWMTAQRIRQPRYWTRMLAPGFAASSHPG